MNWNHFILLLTGVYLGYYALNILADLYLSKTPPGTTEPDDLLFFSDDSEPEIILYEESPETPPAGNPVTPAAAPPAAYPVAAMEATGAVSLKELIRAAQAGLIQYTKAIPY